MSQVHPIKRVTLYIVLISFVAIAIYGYFGITKVEEVSVLDTGTEVVPANTKITYKTESVFQEEDSYVIDIKYPVVDGGASITALNSMNLSIFSEVEDIKNDFFGAVNNEEIFSDNKNTLLVLVNEVSETDQYVNIALSASVYQSGAAHPYSYIRVLNFEKQSGERVYLSDFFENGNLYLLDVSSIAIPKLDAYFKEHEITDWFKEGADPMIENYDNFFIREEGIEFVFDPYQVAPYAFGDVRISILYSELPNISV